MTEREAIEIIGGFIADETLKRKYAKITIIELSDALITLKNLVEKQIAVRPLGFDNGGAEDYEEWAECPKCSESIPEYTLENETECYCLGCGQFLNWSEEG